LILLGKKSLIKEEETTEERNSMLTEETEVSSRVKALIQMMIRLYM